MNDSKRRRWQEWVANVIVLAGSVRLAPGALDKAHPHMERMIAASRAEAGCRIYTYSIDVLDPTLIRVFEVWETEAHLDAHFQSEHIKIWRAAWAEIGLSDRNLIRYEVSAVSPP